MAPCGHTLNLLGIKDFLDVVLNSLELFQEKHRAIAQTFRGRYTPDREFTLGTGQKAINHS